jgi:hypothetical protein
VYHGHHHFPTISLQTTGEGGHSADRQKKHPATREGFVTAEPKIREELDIWFRPRPQEATFFESDIRRKAEEFTKSVTTTARRPLRAGLHIRSRQVQGVLQPLTVSKALCAKTRKEVSQASITIKRQRKDG